MEYDAIKIDKKLVTTRKELNNLYNGSAFTIIGLDDKDSELQQLVKWIRDYSEVSNPLPIYIIKGHTMNYEYGLTKDNRYEANLNLICIKLADIKDVSKIVLPRIQIGARWFDDVVDNDKMREDKKIKPKCGLIGENGNVFNLIRNCIKDIETK